MNIQEFLISSGFVLHNESTLYGGGFMFPDGYYLDMLRTHQEGIIRGSAYPTVTHYDVDLFLAGHDEFGYPMKHLPAYRDLLVIHNNCIKLQDAMVLSFERPYILLPKDTITEAQASKLLDWLYDLYSKTHRSVYIFFRLTKEEVRSKMTEFPLKVEDSTGWTPEELIALIKRTYVIAESQGWASALDEFEKVS